MSEVPTVNFAPTERHAVNENSRGRTAHPRIPALHESAWRDLEGTGATLRAREYVARFSRRYSNRNTHVAFCSRETRRVRARAQAQAQARSSDNHRSSGTLTRTAQRMRESARRCNSRKPRLAEKSRTPPGIHLAGFIKSATTYFPAVQYHRRQRLNFCVRDGNRCDPLSMITDKSLPSLPGRQGSVQINHIAP